jgi:hydrogenase maturation protease
MAARILVAGIGNIFLGDDGFGSEVIRHAQSVLRDYLGDHDLGPAKDRHAQSVLREPDVRAVDYGISGMHLAYDLLDDWDTLVLVDAIPSRGNPGTLHVFQADHEAGSAATGLDAHNMDPEAVFASLRALGGAPPYTVIVGCEAGNVEEGMGLTEPVALAVPRAARAVREIVAALRDFTPTSVSPGEPALGGAD